MPGRLLRRGWCSCSTPGHPAHFDRRRFISGYDSERAERVASGLSTLLQIGLLFHEYFFLAWWTGSTMTKSHVVISYCNHLNLGNSTHDVDPTTLFNCLHWIHEARFNQLKVTAAGCWNGQPPEELLYANSARIAEPGSSSPRFSYCLIYILTKVYGRKS